MMSSNDRIVIVGAGVFGLSLAYQLASDGNQNVTVMDRHVPPVSTYGLSPLQIPNIDRSLMDQALTYRESSASIIRTRLTCLSLGKRINNGRNHQSTKISSALRQSSRQ